MTDNELREALAMLIEAQTETNLLLQELSRKLDARN
jgi:hypothetical protein